MTSLSPTRLLTGLLLALVVAATACSSDRGASRFYDPPDPLPAGAPGDIIRTEPLADVPPDARGWRILYRSTGLQGEPIAVSGVIYIPSAPPPSGGRPVVAWAHPTTGVAVRCAPSLRERRLTRTVQGLDLFLSRGYAVVATDYPGLGTAGPHPYLIGESEGRAVLDSVRAAQRLPESGAGPTFAVWGHSQGGHAALFAGQLAASYAPELRLAGIAAAAPATNLAELFRLDSDTTAGKVLAAESFVAWSKLYPEADYRRLVRPAAVPLIEAIARRCIETEQQYLPSVADAKLLGEAYIATEPNTVEPWRTLFAQNTPGGPPFAAPIFIAQGSADPIVRPQITDQFVRGRCTAGARIDLRIYPGVGHILLGRDAAADAADWITDRFAGRPAPTTCAGQG